MKIIRFTVFILISLVWVCCGNKPQEYALPISSFTGPFPKRNLNLVNILGNELILYKEDTLHLAINSENGFNVIIESKTADTLFLGKVSRYRDLYYFTTQLNDSSYWINAVRISGNLVYGIRSRWMQMYAVDNYVTNGKYPNLIEHFMADTSAIGLRPDKRELRKMYNAILDAEIPDTVLTVIASFAEGEDELPATLDENAERTLKVYPNPATTIVNVELLPIRSSTYLLRDMNGEVRLQGKLEYGQARIDLHQQDAGLYLLSVEDEMGFKEQVRLVKQ